MPDDEARRSLADLRFVNRWLGNRGAPASRAVRPYLRVAAAAAPRRRLRLGRRAALLRARRSPGRSLAVGVDIKLLHLQAAPRAASRAWSADVRALPFRAAAASTW